MSQENKGGFPQRAVQGIKEAYHLNALSAAIFWGKPGWAEKQAKALRLSEEEQRQAVQDAYLSAASREEIIHGNNQKAWEHTKKAFNIPDENPSETPRK